MIQYLVAGVVGMLGSPDVAEDGPIVEIPVEEVTENFTRVDEAQFAWYPAASVRVDFNAPGGFATTGNLPRFIDFKQDEEQDKIYLHAIPARVAVLDSGALGMTLRLVNPTAEVVGFNAADGNLYNMEMQALDQNGRWRAIEKHHHYFCGNSYHQVFLEAGQYWRFNVPRYAGEFETKLRFRLWLESGELILSNEFKGSVNLVQFGEDAGPTPEEWSRTLDEILEGLKPE